MINFEKDSRRILKEDKLFYLCIKLLHDVFKDDYRTKNGIVKFFYYSLISTFKTLFDLDLDI